MAAILKLSEEGESKKVVVVPEYLDGYKVYGLYDLLSTIHNGRIYSDNLEKLYINFEFKIEFRSLVTVDKLFTLNPSYIFTNQIGTSEFRTFVPISININSLDLYEHGYLNAANVTYYSNYGDNDIYWIDDYENEELITYIPEEPKREGYTFDGWYKEVECINKWDFESDKVPGKTYYEDRHTKYYAMDNYEYIETKLYAKWI